MIIELKTFVCISVILNENDYSISSKIKSKLESSLSNGMINDFSFFLASYNSFG